jgi:hypothetical protein
MDLEYSPIPERALHAFEGFPTAFRQDIEDDVDRFRHVPPRSADSDGKVESPGNNPSSQALPKFVSFAQEYGKSG